MKRKYNNNNDYINNFDNIKYKIEQDNNEKGNKLNNIIKDNNFLDISNNKKIILIYLIKIKTK
jgi:hypothetical protein